ncbi:hypothetical protein IPL85_02100 [Candidatus Saccharibacteria bacterium]|nr:MAG: hypothetical protein IPL85_02100 [Candidatus Saccharibacteria bacterium]
MDYTGQIQPQNTPALQNIQSDSNTPSLFSSKQLTTVALLGLLFGLISYGIGYGIESASKASCDIGFGFCAAGGYLGIGIAFVLNVVVAAFVLRKLKVANYVQIVVLATLSLYSAPSFLTLAHLNTLMLVAAAGLLNALAYGFFYWFFNALKFDPTNKLIIAVVVAILAITGSMHLGDKASVQQYEEEQQSKIESYDFNLYRPTYVPAGYSVYSVSPSYDNYPAAYLYVNYLYGSNDIGDPSPFHIYIFNASWERFNPPTDCGPEYPNDIMTFDFPCEEIGETPNGDKIYHHDSNFSNQYNTYAKIDNSIVVLATSSKHLTNSDLIKIMSSLKPTTANELQALYEQDKKR